MMQWSVIAQMCVFSPVPTYLHCPQVVPFAKFYHNLASTSAVHVVVMWGSSVSYSFCACTLFSLLQCMCVCGMLINALWRKFLKRGRWQIWGSKKMVAISAYYMYSMWLYNVIFCSVFVPFLLNNLTVLHTAEWLQNVTILWATEWSDTGEMTFAFIELWNWA